MTTSTVDDVVGRVARAGRGAGVPLLAVLAALVAGGILMGVEGVAPMSVYGEVLRGVLVLDHGLSDTAVAATPLLLLGLGIAIAYRARVFTIGAEGQYIVGAVAATAVVTADGLRTAPGPLLILAALVVSAAAGAGLAAVTAVLNARFGASVVITSLLLNYVAAALLAWAVRVGIREPGAFTPQSRPIGAAGLPAVLEVHLGFPLALAAAAVLGIAMARTRLGFRIDVHGANPEALRANEIRPARLILTVLAFGGALAGVAGYVEVAGVAGRVTPAFATGYGFTAIVVALLGRLRPLGIVVAAPALSALTIGFEVAQRTYEIPSATVGVILALVVVFLVAGDALARRAEG